MSLIENNMRCTTEFYHFNKKKKSQQHSQSVKFFQERVYKLLPGVKELYDISMSISCCVFNKLEKKLNVIFFCI